MKNLNEVIVNKLLVSSSLLLWMITVELRNPCPTSSITCNKIPRKYGDLKPLDL